MTTETTGTFIAVGKIEEALKKVATMMQQDMVLAFDRSGRGDPWAPLKYRKGKPLVLTGALRASGEASSGPDYAQVTAGRGMMHAAIHQFGGTVQHPGSTKGPIPMMINGVKTFRWMKEPFTIHIPARPYLAWIPAEVEQYDKMILGMTFKTEPITVGKAGK